MHRRCNRVGVWHLLSRAADAPQSKRASEREPGPEDFDRIEGKFRIEAALNVVGLPEAMLLAREQEIAESLFATVWRCPFQKFYVTPAGSADCTPRAIGPSLLCR